MIMANSVTLCTNDKQMRQTNYTNSHMGIVRVCVEGNVPSVTGLIKVVQIKAECGGRL